MTDLLFNEMLDLQVAHLKAFYEENEHTVIHASVSVVSEGVMSSAIEHRTDIDFTQMNDLEATLRKLGARQALRYDKLQPSCIFVTRPELAFPIAGGATNAIPPGVPASMLIEVATVLGITNDARYNLAIMNIARDVYGRILIAPAETIHWGSKKELEIDPMPFLEFFKVNSMLRDKEEANAAA